MLSTHSLTKVSTPNCPSGITGQPPRFNCRSFPDHLKHRKDAQDENIKQFTIRLLCRSIFCWFLKERKLITPSLLEIADVTGEHVIHMRPAKSAAEFAKSNSYYRGILQNIFFNCLNTPMDQRRLTAARAANDKTVKDPQLKKLAYRGKNYLPDDFDYSIFDKIPYLNGGLFDCLLEDNASDTIDDEKISVPNKLFYAERVELKSEKKTIEVSGLNRILERYKFTITENTPLEEEIALDPELLGLVFENLLAEVDVSDEGAAKSARKASGSYYTPRRVIDYMVNESLRLHLEGFCKQRGASADEIAALTELIYHDEFDAAKHARLADWIVEAFDTIRILDPACGSGAFPMGALHRMVDILRRVDAGNERWLHRQVSGIPDTQLRKKAETGTQTPRGRLFAQARPHQERHLRRGHPAARRAADQAPVFYFAAGGSKAQSPRMLRTTTASPRCRIWKRKFFARTRCANCKSACSSARPSAAIRRRAMNTTSRTPPPSAAP